MLALGDGFLTLSTCSRFSSLPWSWFLSHRAKSLSCVTAPRVSLSWAYSDFTCADRTFKEQRVWVWECSYSTVCVLWVKTRLFHQQHFLFGFTLTSLPNIQRLSYSNWDNVLPFQEYWHVHVFLCMYMRGHSLIPTFWVPCMAHFLQLSLQV